MRIQACLKLHVGVQMVPACKLDCYASRWIEPTVLTASHGFDHHHTVGPNPTGKVYLLGALGCLTKIGL